MPQDFPWTSFIVLHEQPCRSKVPRSEHRPQCAQFSPPATLLPRLNIRNGKENCGHGVFFHQAYVQASLPKNAAGCALMLITMGPRRSLKIDFWVRKYGLFFPPAVSGHQTYFFWWGPRGYSRELHDRSLDDSRNFIGKPYFEHVRIRRQSADKPHYALES